MKHLAFGAALGLVLVLLLAASLAPSAPVTAQSNTACYRPVGGASFECGDGGSFVVQDGAELVVESGGTLDVQAGSSITLAGYVTSTVDSLTTSALTVNGNAAVTGTFQADGASTLGTVGAGAVTATGLTVNGNATVTGTFQADGASTLGTVGAGAVTATGLTVNGNALVTGTLESDGQATVASLVVEANGDVTGNFEVVDHLLTQAELFLIPPDAITIIDGGEITITAAAMEITAAAEVTATLSTAADGQLVTLINTGSNAINIIDTGTTYMANDVALGQRDTITFIGIGVSWYEIARSNN